LTSSLTIRIKRKMALVGAGAVGSVIGGYISKAGEDITLIDPWFQHVESIRRDGLLIDGTRGRHLVRARSLHTSEMPAVTDRFDLLFVSVKSYDTQSMVTFMKPYLKEDAWVISCQNGMNEGILVDVVGASRTIGCVITMGAEMVGPGSVRETGNRVAFIIGELDGRITPRIHELSEILGLCSDTRVTTNLYGERWSKLARNCMDNPLVVLTDWNARQLHEDARIRIIFQAIVGEIIQVAEAMGHKVEPILGIDVETWKKSALKEQPEVDKALLDEGRRLGERRFSLYDDLRRGRPIEIDHLTGYVVQQGRKLGVRIPVNEAVMVLVKDIELGKIASKPSNIDLLWERIPHRP
jgi:2-dehydropantoate 2-reductase